MISEFLRKSDADEAVYIYNVQKAFNGLKEYSEISLELWQINSPVPRYFDYKVPVLASLSERERDLVRDYLYAKIYNILSALGGRSLTAYFDLSDGHMVEMARSIDGAFGFKLPRGERQGYGRCVNVVERMLQAILPGFGRGFEFTVRDRTELRRAPDKQSVKESDTSVFIRSAKELDERIICGMDIGGSDIKLAYLAEGKIVFFKEFDWFPAQFTRSRQLVDPICLLVRLMRAAYSLQVTQAAASDQAQIRSLVERAMRKDAELTVINEAVLVAEKLLGDQIVSPDAIGLCFPDVVVRDKIVGGEVYKTRGIRNNPDIKYEEDFLQLTHLDDELRKLCVPGGVVKNTNDGPMASFTTAVELCASGHEQALRDGVFAHTLGTELGTGWVDEKGEIPEIPLEVYNSIIDLGSGGARRYDPDDVRSINNFNTGLGGTLQKYPSQSGVFRLAVKYFGESRPDLLKELYDKGFLEKRNNGIYVPTDPEDMRKPFLEHLMGLVGSSEECRRVFLEIGESLAITWFETNEILRPKTQARTLFGRLVKNKTCFALLLEGARRYKPDIVFEIADGSLAYTKLMRQLEQEPDYTVAQFAQAVGAVYFGNRGLIDQLDLQ